MTQLLSPLRFGLIILPAAIGLYVTAIEDYGRYTFLVLLVLALAVLGRRAEHILIQVFLLGLELLIGGWLCQQYGLLMALVMLSAAAAYIPLPNSLPRLLLLTLHLFAMNQGLWRHSERDFADLAAANLVLLLALFCVAMLVRSSGRREETLRLYDELRRKHYELEEARIRMQQFAVQIEGAAQAEERIRISRQLHDDIGHRLIRVKMMMEAALQTVPRDSARGMELLVQIRDQLSASMEEMRMAVKRMNPRTTSADPYALDRLLEETGRETGIRTSFRIEGLPFPLYPSQQVVLYKNAREAITNAIRHGRADQVDMVLRYGSEDICMEVSNSGDAEESSLPNDTSRIGIGFSGMLERTTMLGGRLEIRRQAPFTVITILPVYQKIEIV